MTLTTSDYNGYAVGCSGGRNGWISAAVSGGTPPYTYAWSNGAQEANPGGLGAGYYQVTVMDSDSLNGTASTTLTEPTRLRVQLQLASFPNGYNISCTDCFNGSIAVQATDAVPPYTYLWHDGNTSSTRTGLGHKTNYSVEVTDANGCSAAAGPVQLTQPERDDWTMGGNSGTDPVLHYLGTNDAADFVLKSNGQERLRLGGEGTIKLFGNAMDIGPVFRDEDGTLRIGDDRPDLINDCEDLRFHRFWRTTGNSFNTLCPEITPLLGTLGSRPLIMITNGEERMRITVTGNAAVGDGTIDPQDQFEVHTDKERSGITLLNNRSDANAHTEIRFKKNGDTRWALGCDFQGDGGQDFFIWDAQTNANRLVIDANGKVGIGATPPNNTSLYRLYVGDGIATRDVKVTAQNWPDYVFAPGYRPMSLDDLRKHVSKHRHLPGMYSEAEVAAAGGLEIGDMQVRLLKLLEEQTLYILQLEERMKVLEDRRN